MANKNIEMLKTFTTVITKGDDRVIPDMYAKDIYNIDYKYLKKNKITNLIFDIDNTILEVNSLKVPNKLKDFFKEIEKDFNICILSNNKKERVIPVAYELQTGYIFEANKPNKVAFTRALSTLNSTKSSTAMIGDQMLTDIKGANENGLYSILVDPVSNKYDIKTGTSRLLQNIMTKKIGFKNGVYYRKKDE